MLCGLFENLLGWHIDIADRTKIQKELIKQRKKQKIDFVKPQKGSTYIPLLMEYFDIEFVTVPPVIHYNDLWSKAYRRADAVVHPKGTMNLSYQLIKEKRRKPRNPKNLKQIDDKELEKLFKENLGKFPIYYSSPTSKKYISFKGSIELIIKIDVELLKKIKNNPLNKLDKVKMSLSPLTGEFLSFSLKKGISRGLPKNTLFEMALSIITTLTPYKPCMYDRGKNTAIIPDLPLDKMIDFIRFFKDMLGHRLSSELYYGKVKKEEKGNKKNPTISYKPLRPLLFSGNFPNPPKSIALGGVALLATIGEFVKESEFSQRAKNVLDSLKETNIYLIKYGDAKSYTYNHYIIELAKEGNLRQIVDSIYYSILYNQPKHARWDYNNTDYQKFDLFTARFLQLFNSASFKDFLAFRAEYLNQLEILFNTYFIKMEKIDSKIVTSARQLGKWLNQVAYFTAKAEIKEGSQNYWEKIREQKAKVLVELESAINGELSLDQSKNLVIAFSRLKNSTEKAEKTEEPEVISDKKQENYQNI